MLRIGNELKNLKIKLKLKNVLISTRSSRRLAFIKRTAIPLFLPLHLIRLGELARLAPIQKAHRERQIRHRLPKKTVFPHSHRLNV